jgi:protein-tyrosine kinase
MSRIERAIEEAARVRQQAAPAEPATIAPVTRLVRAGNPEALLAVPPLQVEHPLIVAAGEGDPRAREEYKKLRSLLVRLTRGESFGNTLLVTSTFGEEGKSMTALNLAITLAQEYDHTVLLVDADLRRPALHRYLGIEPKVGLIQCLQGSATLPQALVKTGLGKLVVLPAGGTVSNPAELLGSKRMLELIDELKHRYPDRYIIFDTPPTLPFADAQVLAGSVDGVLFVVREGSAKLSDIKESLSGLQKARLLGVIYNDALFPRKKGSYYYY